MTKFTLAIHGGAFLGEKEYSKQTQFLKDVLHEGHKALYEKKSAFDVVCEAVCMMENSGLYIAGKGAGANSAGEYELDASVMDGKTGQAGAVASLKSYKNPVYAARKVMEDSPHVLMVSDGAEKFLVDKGLERITDPKNYFTPSHPESQMQNRGEGNTVHGTVGAVALDQNGNLAVATSTGGIVGKLAGRVGDTPIIGAASYADDTVAVSTTGYGEYYIRNVAAYDVSARMKYQGHGLAQSVDAVLDGIKQAGGWGGIISVDRNGDVKLGFRCTGMHRGYVRENGEIRAFSYPEDKNT